ncbi:MAG: hypothetical protein OER59_08095 [Desulfobulbaceae bacterium]|jgi:hypothetical protein|nr:hypothetical protein [Desulfobacteraceae bacterium]MDH3574339.1 hypothetical protein [Desulfobacteraceae bacterium]MDH3777005.1 hypothetical protein [Desulfobulbaceae bacterium]MDH3782170.1 hypothetical protein [Desulfobulbaceae bacterium]MDH3865580.1 hypothetical protein [Desulfobulbaceae bacterium]
MAPKLKRTRNRHDCPLGLWQLLIDDPLPEGHPEYNSFQEFVSLHDWQQHKAEVLSYWIERYPGTRPKTWWFFEIVVNRPEKQAAYLLRHDLLTDTEKAWLDGHKEALEPEKVEV